MPRQRVKKPILIVVVAVADMPDKEGNIFLLATLQAIADSDPLHYWMDGNYLLTNKVIGRK